MNPASVPASASLMTEERHPTGKDCCAKNSPEQLTELNSKPPIPKLGLGLNITFSDRNPQLGIATERRQDYQDTIFRTT
jgi:hypothetical protein